MYTDFAFNNKPGELKNEGMVLNLDRNNRKAEGYYFVDTLYDNNEKIRAKNIELR